MFSEWHFNDKVTKKFSNTKEDEFYWSTPNVMDAGYSFYGYHDLEKGRFYVIYARISFCTDTILRKVSFIPEKGKTYTFSVEITSEVKIKVESKKPVKDLIIEV